MNVTADELPPLAPLLPPLSFRDLPLTEPHGNLAADLLQQTKDLLPTISLRLIDFLLHYHWCRCNSSHHHPSSPDLPQPSLATLDHQWPLGSRRWSIFCHYCCFGHQACLVDVQLMICGGTFPLSYFVLNSKWFSCGWLSLRVPMAGSFGEGSSSRSKRSVDTPREPSVSHSFDQKDLKKEDFETRVVE